MAWAGPATRPAAFANAILGTGLSDDPWIVPCNPNMSGNLSSMDVAGGIAGGDPIISCTATSLCRKISRA